jgi:hypothetical protein
MVCVASLSLDETNLETQRAQRTAAEDAERKTLGRKRDGKEKSLSQP